MGDCSTLISGTINQTLTQSGQPSSFQMCSPGGQRGIALIYIPGEPGRLGSERAVGGWEASSEHPCRGREGIPIEKTQPQHCSRKGEQQNPPLQQPRCLPHPAAAQSQIQYRGIPSSFLCRATHGCSGVCNEAARECSTLPP